jgi:hypothetical protein
MDYEHIFAIKFYFEKWFNEAPNSEILHIWKVYLSLEIVKQDKMDPAYIITVSSTRKILYHIPPVHLFNFPLVTYFALHYPLLPI